MRATHTMVFRPKIPCFPSPKCFFKGVAKKRGLFTSSGLVPESAIYANRECRQRSDNTISAVDTRDLQS
jgi:hypothetical protein